MVLKEHEMQGGVSISEQDYIFTKKKKKRCQLAHFTHP
jgi:hypothetical protein